MAAETLETKVRELADREAIRDLPVRYCHYVWTNDVEGLVGLFAEDGSITTSDPELPRARGRLELRGMYRRALGELTPLPFIHNHVVTLEEPGRARGTCYVEVRGVRSGQAWIATGFYDDEYVKVGDDWKFLSRKLTFRESGPPS